MCTVCMNPVDYGDGSDMSEEIDSSEDESELRKRNIQKQAREAKLEQLQHERTDGNVMHRFQRMMGLKEITTENQQRDSPAAKTNSKSDISGNNKYNCEECSDSDEGEIIMIRTNNNHRESIKDLLVTEDIFEDTTTGDSESDFEDIHVNVPLQEPRRCVLCRN
ncbi:hypothetical protein CHS0354_032074 [Potamilus streckersoni]|uniref:Uncharacterized protein n=1 Tax=Potamilus streckersoni TaxID=2493646 RepID=A0AAE0TN67_9BIVA|nr:hypothetical protein CHS0354_032074 [Potamilus streckersoni]